MVVVTRGPARVFPGRPLTYEEPVDACMKMGFPISAVL